MRSASVARRTQRYIFKFISTSFQVPVKQIPRILFHGLILACIIAGFWVLDSLKDPILANTVGMEYQPLAKLLSVVVILFIVCIYDFLTSIVSKPNLFHIISVFYGLVIMIYAAVLSSDTIGLGNTSKHPSRWIGWCAYFTVESYGSLMVALFWSFTNSVMDLEEAKGAYGLIIAIAQLGAIMGSTLATNAAYFGIPYLFIFGAILIFPVSLLIKLYHLIYRDSIPSSITTRVRSDSETSSIHYAQNAHQPHQLDHEGGDESAVAVTEPLLQANLQSLRRPIHHYDSSPSSSSASSPLSSWERDLYLYLQKTSSSLMKFLQGFYEGLSLILKYPYVLKLLGVSCLYEIVVVILDYEFKLMGSYDSVRRAEQQQLQIQQQIMQQEQQSATAVTAAGVAAVHAVVDAFANTAGTTMNVMEDVATNPLTSSAFTNMSSISSTGSSSVSGLDMLDNISLVSGNNFANLLGHFGQFTNLVAFCLSLFGFSYLVHHIGVNHSLMIFPISLLIAVVVCYLVPSLWMFFFFVSTLKAMLFSLHDPLKELLYIPTSESIKFKAKAWIDVFGSRLAKAMGSFITSLAFGNTARLRQIGEVPALVLSLVVLWLTWSIGDDFLAQVASNTVVGDVAAKVVYDTSHLHGGKDEDEEDRIDSNGRRPGEVGYTGYDPQLFEGVNFDNFDYNREEEDDEEGSSRIGRGDRFTTIVLHDIDLGRKLRSVSNNDVFDDASTPLPARVAGTGNNSSSSNRNTAIAEQQREQRRKESVIKDRATSFHL